MDANRLIETEEDQEDFVNEEDYEEEEYYEEDYEEDFVNEEEEEVDDSIPVGIQSPSVSGFNADGGMLQAAAVINNGLLDNSNNSQSCNENPAHQDPGEGGEGSQELNRGETDGLLCPICFQPWTNNGEHRICCLPCGHIYGLSCIKKWLQLRPNSTKCPQCNSLCTLKDVRVLYTAGLCVADEVLQNKVLSLEAKCASLEQQGRDFETQRCDIMMQVLELKTCVERHAENMETSFKQHQEKIEVYVREIKTLIREILEVRGYKTI